MVLFHRPVQQSGESLPCNHTPPHSTATDVIIARSIIDGRLMMLFRSREHIEEEIKGRECVLGLPRTMYDIRLQEGVYNTGNCLDKD